MYIYCWYLNTSINKILNTHTRHMIHDLELKYSLLCLLYVFNSTMMISQSSGKKKKFFEVGFIIIVFF